MASRAVLILSDMHPVRCCRRAHETPPSTVSADLRRREKYPAPRRTQTQHRSRRRNRRHPFAAFIRRARVEHAIATAVLEFRGRAGVEVAERIRRRDLT